MKKFCSSCGSQLELSKRTCGECGAANPFFIANFTFLEDQSDGLERLRLEKEKIEKELAAKEAAQAEFQRQEQLKKELEELEKQKRETLEKEMQIREALEQTPESQLKKQLQQVKDDTDLYKKETLDLLQEIREELKQKTEDLNRKAKAIQVEKPVSIPAPERNEAPKGSFIYEAPDKKSTISSVAVFVILLLVGLSVGSAYVYFNRDRLEPQESVQTIEPESVTPESTPQTQTPANTENSFTSNSNDSAADTQQPVTTETQNPIAEASVISKPSAPAAEESPKKFELSVSRAMNDLIGRKLSGCNIVIHSVSEIDNITHPELIEKLPSGYLKFKLKLEVAQNNEIYNSTPYLYYTSDGRFLKIDGTNCE